MSYLEERLEKDLDKIHDQVAEQAKQVEAAVSNAIHALQTGNKKLAFATVLNDLPINRTMRQIDANCHKFIATHLHSDRRRVLCQRSDIHRYPDNSCGLWLRPSGS